MNVGKIDESTVCSKQDTFVSRLMQERRLQREETLSSQIKT